MADILTTLGSVAGQLYNNLPTIIPREKVIITVQDIQEQMFRPPAQGFVRLAGISGAMAVGLGAYGSHVMRHKDVDPKLKETFEVANKYHFLHTLGLLAVPLARKPLLAGGLMSAGMLLFSGSCYYHALTGNQAVRKVTPYGGFLLIFAWIAFAL